MLLDTTAAMAWWWTERRSRELRVEVTASVLLALPILSACAASPDFAGLCTIAAVSTIVPGTVDAVYYVFVHAARPQSVRQVAIAYLLPITGVLLHVLWLVLCLALGNRAEYGVGVVVSLLMLLAHALVALMVPWPYALTPFEMASATLIGTAVALVVVAAM